VRPRIAIAAALLLLALASTEIAIDLMKGA
jgi:hypothetical protein